MHDAQITAMEASALRYSRLKAHRGASMQVESVPTRSDQMAAWWAVTCNAMSMYDARTYMDTIEQ